MAGNKINSVNDKFIMELGDISNAEQQIVSALQQMISEATDQMLIDLFQQHLSQTCNQIQRLDQVWDMLGQKPAKVTCDGMSGILTESKKTMLEAQTDTLRDGVMAGGADKVEHYEISSYNNLILGAQLMGQNQIVGLLQQNLDEERWMAQQLQQRAPQHAEKAMVAEGMHPSAGASGQTVTNP